MTNSTRIPQINLNRTVAKGTARGPKVNPNNPMTKGQARLLFFAVKELTGERLDLFSDKTPKLVHSDITELCGILRKDSGATQDDQQMAIEILVSDLRVPILESTTKPVSSAGRAAAKKAAAVTVKAGKVGIEADKEEPTQKMTPVGRRLSHSDQSRSVTLSPTLCGLTKTVQGRGVRQCITVSDEDHKVETPSVILLQGKPPCQCSIARIRSLWLSSQPAQDTPTVSRLPKNP